MYSTSIDQRCCQSYYQYANMKVNQGYTASFPIILSLVLMQAFLSIQPLKAAEAEVKVQYYHSLLSGSINPIADLVELASDMLRAAGSPYTLDMDQNLSRPLLVTCDNQYGEGPLLLLVVDLNHVGDAALSLSAWLVMLEQYISASKSCAVTFSILPVSRPNNGTILEAGKVFWMPVDPYQSLASLNPYSVILLDMVQEAQQLDLEAESKGKLSPLHVLRAVRASLNGMGIAYSENVVKALYARAGLIDGSAGLAPWLDLGVPAIRLHGRFDEEIQLLPSSILAYQDSLGEDWANTRDVNYLRYQLPTALISLDDIVVTRVILLLLGMFMASVALRPLFTRKHSDNPGPGALPEALVAYLFSFIAVFLSWLVHGFAAGLLGSASLTIDLPPLALAIGIIGRLGSTLLFFFALSGLSARLGLLPHAIRGTASQASAMIAGMLGMSVLFFSIQGSLLLFGTMILLSLAGINAAIAMLSIFALVVILLPLVFNAVPVFVPGLVTVLNAQGIQLLLLAGFTAPVALWVLTTLSPRHRLVRGDKTAPYLVALALILCFLDPWLRTQL